jgi:OOP family OmpA-OmpF porin
MKNILITLMALSAGLVNAQTNNNWMASGQPVKNSSGHCWRNSSWTPATAHPDCDGAIKAPVAVAQSPTPAQKVDIAKPTATIAARAPIAPEVKKLVYGADTFFDFDKSVIKPEGKEALTKLVKSMSNVTLEVVIVVGHTDAVGTDSYNMKLGARRAESVRAFLISNGIESKRVYTESKGERNPVADNKTAAGRAKNRRVEIEVVGSVKN